MKSDWKLDSIRIDFYQGHEFMDDPEQKIDRYEGKIEFTNGDQESFAFRVKSDMAQKYIDLIAQDIVFAANNLGKELIKSLKLNDKPMK